MKAQPVSMSDILAGPKQYVIPVFQRYYEWQHDRWQVFWQDLSALVDEYDTNLTHFIGPMVIIAEAVPYDAPRYLVIDGQQRLMTIFVLLSVIRDRAKALKLKNIANAIDLNSLFFFNTDGDRMNKLIPRLRDRDTLSNILNTKHKELDPDSLLTKAYDYFTHEVGQISPIQGDLFADEPEKILDTLYQTITQRLRIVMITLDHDDNPSNIFESLNFKSEKLSDADLIRNYVFMQMKTVEEQEEFNNAVWKSFEELFNFSDKSRQLLTDFYYRYLISRTEYLARKRLYNLFTSYVDKFLKDDKPTKLLQLVNELKQFAHYFISIIHKCDDSDLETAFKRFRELDTDTAIPLIVYLYEKYEKRNGKSELSKPQFLNMLRIIESFILRRSILRERTRGYGLNFANARPHASDLNSLMKYFASKGWPTDRHIREAIKDFAFYHRERKKCSLILKEIERSFGHKERVNLNELTIEHVMPQNLTSNWRKMLGSHAEELHEKYLHTIGNLTLTGYNLEMGDSPYEEKRQVYRNSNLQLNSYFKTHEKWTDKEILERTETLTARFIDLWIRPDEIDIIPTTKGLHL